MRKNPGAMTGVVLGTGRGGLYYTYNIAELVKFYHEVILSGLHGLKTKTQWCS